jgi:hypothetical protein
MDQSGAGPNESQDVGSVPLALVNDHALAGLFVGSDAERPHADLRAGDLPRLHVWRPACGDVCLLLDAQSDQSQKMTAAAMQMADMNVCAHRS